MQAEDHEGQVPAGAECCEGGRDLGLERVRLQGRGGSPVHELGDIDQVEQRVRKATA